MNKVLITGGAGFIGRKTASMLKAQGIHVRIIDTFSEQIHADPEKTHKQLSSEYEVITGDVCDLEAVQSALDGVDGVLHLAAETGVGQSMYEIDSHIRTNLLGTATLCKALRTHGRGVSSVVLASSRAVYGEGQYFCSDCEINVSPDPRLEPALLAGQWEPICPECNNPVASVETAENAARKPGSIYAISKATQEDLLQCACDSAGIANTSLRYFNVYGEGQALGNPYTGILTSFVTRLKAGRALHVYEDGYESRDFIHVDDVAAANVKALLQPPVERCINIGSGTRLSIHELAVKMSAIFDVQAPPEVTGEFRIGDIRHCIADTSKASDKFQYSTKVTLDDGLQRFCDWARSESSVDRTDQAHEELVNEGLLKKSPAATRETVA